MKIIKELSAQMLDELEGAREYAISALDYKLCRPELARLYKDLAQTEYQHANQLHDWAVRMVQEANESGITPPPEMLEKWETLHRLAISQMAEVKVYLDLYR